MKKIVFFVLALLIIVTVQSQTKDVNNNLLCSIKWDENIVQKQAYLHTVKSIEAYCFVDDNIIALINAETQKIITYSLNSNEIVKTIPLQYGTIDFDYYNGKFHVYDFNRVYIINERSQVEQELHFLIPERTPFALEKFKVINGKNNNILNI